MFAIAEASARCMRSFSSLSSCLENGKREHQDLMPSADIEDEYGRFRVWCGNLGALQKGHASLDFRLRESIVMQGNVSDYNTHYDNQKSDCTVESLFGVMVWSVRHNVLALLEKLFENVSEMALRRSLRKSTGSLAARKHISVANSSDSNPGVSVISQARLPYEQQMASDSPHENDYSDSSSEGTESGQQMTELQMRLSSIRYILNHMNKLSFMIRNPALRPISHKATLYHENVRVDGEEKDEVKAVSMDEEARYWSRYADKLAAGSFTEEVRVRKPQPSNEVRSRTESYVHTGDSFAKGPALVAAPPKVYPDTEVTATYDKKLDDMLDAQSVVSYASTAWDLQGRGVELPPPPQWVAAGRDFKLCPYCSVLCPAKHGKGRAWSRSVWAEHEAQSHRKVWQCYEHSGAVFRSPEVLADHLYTQHSESLTESQISDLVDVAETSLIDERAVCPICFGDGPFTKGLQNHLANHLERVALFALPPSSGGVEGNSNAGSNVPQGVGAMSQASWLSGSLTFSDYGSMEEEDQESDHHRDARKEIESLFKSAENCHGRDKLDEAKKKYQQALEKIEETLGPEHLLILDAVTKLADVYTDQREFDEVEKMYLRALEGYERLLGPESLATIDTITKLCNLYLDQGNLDKAESMCYRVLRGREHIDGLLQPSILELILKVGTLYEQEEKLAKAEILYKQALKGSEMIRDSTIMIHTATQLTNLYTRQGRLDEAANVSQQMLDANRRMFGSVRPSAKTCMADLAKIYSAQGRLKEAQALQVEVLDIQKWTERGKVSDTITSMANLASTYSKQGLWKKAEELQLEITQIRTGGSEKPTSRHAEHHGLPSASAYRIKGDEARLRSWM